jgi:hypothetical protein
VNRRAISSPRHQTIEDVQFTDKVPFADAAD